MLLWKFTLRHDIVSNSTKTTRIARTLAELLTSKSNILLANWRWNIEVEFHVTILYPNKIFASTIAFIITFKPSATNKKRKWERGSPYRKPLSIRNSSVGLPLTNTEAEDVQIHSFIHFLHKLVKDILPKEKKGFVIGIGYVKKWER